MCTGAAGKRLVLGSRVTDDETIDSDDECALDAYLEAATAKLNEKLNR